MLSIEFCFAHNNIVTGAYIGVFKNCVNYDGLHNEDEKKVAYM